MPEPRAEEIEEETCEHNVTVGFVCNECSVRAGRTVRAGDTQNRVVTIGKNERGTWCVFVVVLRALRLPRRRADRSRRHLSVRVQQRKEGWDAWLSTS